MKKKTLSKINLGNGEDKTFLIWERHWLSEWGNLDISDKKVLAALYWEDLTDTQKSDFTDSDYISLQKIKAAKHSELMSDPVLMKKNFLEGAAPLIDEMLALANGKKKNATKDSDTEAWAKREIWEVLKDIITRTDNPAPMIDLKGKSIEDQIDQILTKVSEGRISIADAKEYMALVSAGFNLQQLPKLLATLESLENKP